MATTRRTSTSRARRSTSTARPTSGRASAPAAPRRNDRIPPHWPDDLDVPVPTLTGGEAA